MKPHISPPHDSMGFTFLNPANGCHQRAIRDFSLIETSKKTILSQYDAESGACRPIAKRVKQMQPNQAVRSRTSVGSSVALMMAVIGISFLFGGCTLSPEAEKGVPINTQPSAGSARVQALMLAQVPLLAAADQIRALDPQGSGLGGLRIDIEQRTLEVWWKGAPPESVREEIARQERNGGIRVQLQSSPYTQRELVEVTRDIMKRAGEYPGVVSAGPLVDGSGLEIGVADTTRAASLRFPVPIRVVSAPRLVALSRGADTPPWWAGAVTRAAGSQKMCSTGFAMAGAFGKQGMLTADHCSCGGNVVFTNGVGAPIGLADTDNNNLFTDSLLISTNRPGTSTYDGGVGVGEFSKPVVGKQSNTVGMLTCTSGAGTGVHCGVIIDEIDQSFKDPTTNSSFCPQSMPFTEGVTLAHQIDSPSNVSVGSGDSGGPVFTLAVDPSTVKAAGMIFGGLNPVSCAGSGSCFNGVAFHDADNLERSHNASIYATSPPPRAAGGATTISRVVFGGAAGLWALIRRSRRSQSKPQRSTENGSGNEQT